jgi:hypothetical protein
MRVSSKREIRGRLSRHREIRLGLAHRSRWRPGAAVIASLGRTADASSKSGILNGGLRGCRFFSLLAAS